MCAVRIKFVRKVLVCKVESRCEKNEESAVLQKHNGHGVFDMFMFPVKTLNCLNPPGNMSTVKFVPN